MPNLVDFIGQQLGNVDINALSAKLGLSPEATKSAIAHTMPAMIDKLATHAAGSPAAADELHASLSTTPPAFSIVETATVAVPSVAEAKAADVDDLTLQHISASAGVGLDQLKELLPLLAPVLTGALAHAKTVQGLSASDVSGLLQTASERLTALAGGALTYAKAHSNEIEDGAIGAGIALTGKYMLDRLFGK